MRSALADEFFISDLRSLIYSGRISDRFFSFLIIILILCLRKLKSDLVVLFATTCIIQKNVLCIMFIEAPVK